MNLAVSSVFVRVFCVIFCLASYCYVAVFSVFCWCWLFLSTADASNFRAGGAVYQADEVPIRL